jgi:hypothetical protein
MNIFDKGKQIVIAAPQLYIDVDIETDGWAGFGSMLSLGAVSPEGETFYSEIRPLDGEYVPAQREFCEKYGLERERLLLEAPHYSEVMTLLSEWVLGLNKASGKIPVFSAFNAGFDFGFVQLYYLRAGLKNPFGSAPFDLKSLALILNPSWDWSLTAKSQLPPAILPEGDFTHHALEDAIYQQKLHFGMAGLLGKSDLSSSDKTT